MEDNMDESQLAKKGKEYYEQHLKDRLEKEYRGKIIAIDIDSGDYFFGETVSEAVSEGRQKYPGKVFYAVRIGYKAVHFHRRLN
jgi:hypothetical protein